MTQPDLHRGEKWLLIVVALIAAASGLAGAGIGGCATNRAAIEQVRADREQDVTERRKAAYADYLVVAIDLQNFEYQIWDGFTRGVLTTEDSVQKKVAELNALAERLYRTDATVAIVSSDDVDSARAALTDKHAELQRMFYDLAEVTINGKRDQAVAQMPAYDALRLQAKDLLHQFITQVRADLD